MGSAEDSSAVTLSISVPLMLPVMPGRMVILSGTISTLQPGTNAYVEDASTDGHGLALIHQDGEEGTLLQVAGNLKEIVNFTPKSTLQIARLLVLNTRVAELGATFFTAG